MKKNKIFILVLIILLLAPISSLAKKNSKKVIIFSIDSISMENIKELEIDNYGIGLFNSKSRKPYNEKNLYTSINIGRKISREKLVEEAKLEYMGDILKEENPVYIGDQNSNIKLLISDKNDKANGINHIEYDYEWLDKNIKKLLLESKLVALDYRILDQKNRLEILKKLIYQNRDNLIYIIPRTVHKSDKMYVNQYLLPILKIDKTNGVLMSSSTKRESLIALEDISFDIKENFKKENKFSIGKSIEIENKSNNLKDIEQIYKKSINMLYISYIFHGILYLSQGLILIYLLTNRLRKIAISTFIFTTNNIWITLIMSLIDIQYNLLLYLILIIIINTLITKEMIKNNKYVEKSIVLTYFLIVLGILFKTELIYNSYIGYNNLIYGARYYGFNNGIAAVLLASSIFTIIKVDDYINSEKLKKILIATIPIINLICLSTNFGANTGAFISAIILLILIYYNYLFSSKINIKTLIIFIIIGITIFAINIYYDSISLNKSHAIQFFERIKLNGFGEIYYMVTFKLKELIKLTIMPPFSIVLICQFIILKKLFVRNHIGIKIMLIVSLVGFIINDTGNILLVYMLNYLILALLIKNEYIKNTIVKI